METYTEEYEFYPAQAGEGFAALARDGMRAVFLYSDHVYSDAGICRYCADDPSVRTVALKGEIFVPTLLFTDFCGAALRKEGETVVLSRNGNVFCFRLGEQGSYREGAQLYVPLAVTARALGLAAGTYEEGRLAVVGEMRHLAVLDADAALAHAGCYLVLGGYDPSTFTPEDYRAARANWRCRLVGSPQINDLSDPTIREKVASVSKECERTWKTMNRAPDRPVLWGDSAPVESQELEKQYAGLVRMAKGWGTYGSDYYLNEDLHRDILDGMRWMYEHMYGEAEIAGTGWRDAHLFNWWYWYIAAPEAITDISFIREDSFTQEEKRTYLKCFDWLGTFMRRGMRRDMALSRICICTKVALALCDGKRLREEYVDFDLLLGLGETEEGPRVDYTQWTHGFPMNIGYGRLNLDRVLYTVSGLTGTALVFQSPKLYNLFSIVKYMFEPAIYRARGFMMLYGRSTSWAELDAGAAALAYMLAMIGMFGRDEDAYLKHMIKRHAVNEEAVAAIRRVGNIADCVLLDSILRDPTVSADNDYEYAHAWFTGDRASQQRHNYAIGIAMTSRREFCYECINGQNMTGWHTGDGATYLYTEYDDHPYDGEHFLAKNIRIAYRFPGTTEDARERKICSIGSAFAWHPPRDFAGALQIEDKYLVAAMDFEAYHFEGPVSEAKDMGYGGPLPIHHNDLTAKKAWFCFDNEIVALGAGITSTMHSAVSTTVDHRRLVGEERRLMLSQAGTICALPQEDFDITCRDASWALLEGHAGYVLLSPGELSVTRYRCDDQPYFCLGIEHGENPADAAYAYAILPYAGAQDLDRYAAAPDVDILANTAHLQAVRENRMGLTGYVFYKAGQCGELTASAPAITTVRERDGTLSFSMTDPTHRQTEVTFTLDRPLTLARADRGVTVAVGAGQTVIRVACADANGRPMRAEFTL